MGAMLGVVLSGNLIQLAFFWELTSLFSFLLIGYWHHRATPGAARAWRSPVTGVGGLVPARPGCCSSATSSAATTDVVLARATLVRAHPLYPAALVLVLAGRLHQERAVPVPLLAAPRHGGADAGLGLSAFGDHGEGRRVPAGAPVAGALGHRSLVLDRRRRRACHAAVRRVVGDLPARPQGAARLLDDLASGADRPAARAQQPAGGRGRALPHHESRHLQGVAVHGGRASSTTRPARATSGS